MKLRKTLTGLAFTAALALSGCAEAGNNTRNRSTDTSRPGAPTAARDNAGALTGTGGTYGAPGSGVNCGRGVTGSGAGNQAGMNTGTGSMSGAKGVGSSIPGRDRNREQQR